MLSVGDPEDLGPRQLGLGHPDAGLGGGDDQRPGVGEPQGRGQVDREPEVGRCEWGLMNCHGCGERRRAWFAETGTSCVGIVEGVRAIGRSGEP